MFDVDTTLELEVMRERKIRIVGLPRPFRTIFVCHADTFDMGEMDYGNEESVLISNVQFVDSPYGNIGHAVVFWSL